MLLNKNHGDHIAPKNSGEGVAPSILTENTTFEKPYRSRKGYKPKGIDGWLGNPKSFLAHASPSIEGQGGQRNLWYVCKQLKRLGAGEETAFDLLCEHFNPRCEPPWQEHELRNTLRRAFGQDSSTETTAKRCKVDEKLRSEVMANPVLDAEFCTFAPSPCERLDPYFFLQKLYADPEALICMGRSVQCCLTRSMRLWSHRLHGIQYIVPNPMSATMGKSQEGKERYRTLDNTGPRKYLVVEFDLAERDSRGKDTRNASFIREQRAKGLTVEDINSTLIAHLGKKAPLVMAVSSGGKSLHGWFKAEGKADATVEAFFQYACTLGADPQLWVRCQPVRLPDGVRDNGRPQAVKYFNPELL